MAANKVIRFGPVAMSTSAVNIINPPTISGGTGLAGTNTSTYLIIKHIRIINTTASSANFSLFIGASGAKVAGTEFVGNTVTIYGNQYLDWYGSVRLDTADYLTGYASATGLTFQAEGEIGIA